ncbi:isochorismatase [Kushneria pakistanensis]|uniref:isochorismatase n=1 Tax=Kushneria pakistanensis TaxID=1508770 RepID=A0ABQ3FKD4_9GAMM|nr:isochorismatase family protein [Kushneria pakistanensis]GHC26713.1 isochorismatase [Kushneria pakistanensis]
MAIPAIASYSLPTAAELPDNRVGWQVDPARAVLLIHDMQRYFLAKYDVSAAPIPEVISHLAGLIAAARAAGVPVVYTAQPTDQPDSDRALLNDFWGPGLPGHPEQYPVVDELAPQDGDVVLTKWRYSAFQRSDLRERMRSWGRDQLIIGGVYAHIGCMATALEGFMQDVQCFMLTDGVADFSRARHDMALEYVAGRCGVVTTSARALEALESAQNDQRGAGTMTQAALTERVATLAGVSAEEIPADDNLLFYGLDSMRMMTFVEELRREGFDVSFMDLVEAPTITDWVALLNRQGVSA